MVHFIQPAESHCSVPLALARFNSFADSFTTQHAGAKLSKYKSDQCLKRQLYSFRCKHEELGTSQSSSSGCFLGPAAFLKVCVGVVVVVVVVFPTWNLKSQTISLLSCHRVGYDVKFSNTKVPKQEPPREKPKVRQRIPRCCSKMVMLIHVNRHHKMSKVQNDCDLEAAWQCYWSWSVFRSMISTLIQ